MQRDAVRSEHLSHPSGVRIHRLAQQQFVPYRDDFC